MKKVIVALAVAVAALACKEEKQKPADEAYVKSLMHPVHERGKMANWIAPPAKGINGMPVDFEYVKPPDA